MCTCVHESVLRVYLRINLIRSRDLKPGPLLIEVGMVATLPRPFNTDNKHLTQDIIKQTTKGRINTRCNTQFLVTDYQDQEAKETRGGRWGDFWMCDRNGKTNGPTPWQLDYYYYFFYYYFYVSCHRPILPGNSLEPTVIPTAQASSFTLQYFPYYVWCFKHSCLL